MGKAIILFNKITQFLFSLKKKMLNNNNNHNNNNK